MDLLLPVAVGLLLAGVVGSVLPLVPGVPLSLAGIYGYWWGTGFSEPGELFVLGATVVGGVAVLADYLGGALSARAGGGSLATTAAAAVAGLLALLVAGPLGMLAGVALATFAVEFYRTRDARRGLRTAAYAAVGTLASAVFQLLVTLTLLVSFLAVVVL